MRFLLPIFLLISLSGFGQWKSFIISVRGDTLNRVDMQGRKQGPWAVRQNESRGEMGFDEQGYYVNDKKDGRWTRFSLIGDKIAEENYKWGSLHGKQKYYTRNGFLERVESWRAIDPDKAGMDTVDIFDLHDPTKVVDRVVVKLEGTTMKHGNWIYYEPYDGVIEKTERYFLDKLQLGDDVAAAGGVEGDDELKPIAISAGKTKTDTTGKKTVTKPKEVLEYEKKNSGKKKVKTRDGQTGY